MVGVEIGKVVLVVSFHNGRVPRAVVVIVVDTLKVVMVMMEVVVIVVITIIVVLIVKWEAWDWEIMCFRGESTWVNW